MTIESAIYDRLRDAAGDLYPLVGLRIYPVIAPQNVTFPCVTWQRISSERVTAMGSDPGLVRMRVQVDGWASTYESARLIAEAIRTRLERWRNASAPVVQDTFFINATDEVDDATSGPTPVYRTLNEFELIYEG